MGVYWWAQMIKAQTGIELGNPVISEVDCTLILLLIIRNAKILTLPVAHVWTFLKRLLVVQPQQDVEPKLSRVCLSTGLSSEAQVIRLDKNRWVSSPATSAITWLH